MSSVSPCAGRQGNAVLCAQVVWAKAIKANKIRENLNVFIVALYLIITD
jgi:hypothetical protein